MAGSKGSVRITIFQTVFSRLQAEYTTDNATDELELDRLDLQHQVFLKTLGGALHRAPIGGHPQRVLDLGTGTGIWAVDFAHTCPSAEVIGTDLSPVQPTNVPPNCRFYVEDCDTDWSFDGPFDFIHGRMLVVAITNWTRLVKQAFANLRPGGWIELQDLSFPFRCDDGTAAPDSAVLHWSSCLLKAAGELGIDLTASTRFPTMLNAAGFVDVHVETHAWPINSWPRDRALKEIGMYVCEDLHQGLEGFSLSMFSRGLKWEDEQIKQVLSDAARDIRNTSAHIYLPISICWARKPGPADS
jgi:SAM-dependent methyltransferase